MIDTNVISEVGKGAGCNSEVASWYASVSRDSLALSSLVVGELRTGIERLRQRDPSRAKRIERTLILVIDLFADRILGVDRRVAERWGHLNAAGPVPTVDALIAATALVHELVVVTRNVRDFERTGIEVLNPFEPRQ